MLEPLTARIMRAMDGDALEVAPDDAPHRPLKIRLAYLDAPERGQAWSGEAHIAMQQFTAGKNCIITPVVWRGRVEDRWGRIIALVTAHGQDLTAWAITHGHGRYWTLHGRAPDDILYIHREATAREARLGVWRGPRVPRG